jgi:hypothetical protein
MRAQPGNWLIIEQADIRWLDTGHKAPVFPEPGTHVVTRDEL